MCLADKACPYPEMMNGLCVYHNVEREFDETLHEVTNFNHTYSEKDLYINENGMHLEGQGTRKEVKHKLKGGTVQDETQKNYRRAVAEGRVGRPRVSIETVSNANTPYPVRMKVRDDKDRIASGITHKFTVDGVDCYVIVNLFENGLPGEVFLNISDVEKRGSGIGSFGHGMGDCLSILLSLALQHGVPLDLIVQKLSYTRFAPMGITNSSNKDLKFATSIVDYLVRWMDMRFLKGSGHKDNWANQFTSAQKDRIDTLKGTRRVVAHCHLCNVDLYSMEESTEHNKKFLIKHQTLNASKMEKPKEESGANNG